MFKNRYFVVGLGCGIIVGALLLQMIITGQNLMPTLTNEQLEREAERQGYQLVPVNDKNPENVESPVGTLSHSNTADASEEVQATVEEDEVQMEVSTSSVEELNETVYKDIHIKPNTTSSAIAKQLMEAGVIADDVGFAQYIKTQQMQSKLRAGYFKFQVPSTHAQALEVLTSHPNG